MSAIPKNLRLHLLGEDDASIQTDDAGGVLAPAISDPDGVGHPRHDDDNEFTQTNLVSDGFVPAAHIDPNLVNPWGIALSATSPFWISDNGTGLTTVYDGAGNLRVIAGHSSITIATPPGQTTLASPTGDVSNIAGSGFNITSSGVTASSRFIFATEDGTISGWNPGVNSGASTVLAVDNSHGGTGAVYKGLAIGTDTDGTFLYATNFRNGTVDVFNSNFQQVNSFTDPKVQNGFAPFGVQVLGGHVFVTFAKQDAQKHDDVAGPGNGYVDEFSMDGQLLDRVATRGHLDSPWGLAIAPSGFGQFANDLLVGNFGDGTIDVFNPNTDQYLGKLDGTDGKPIQIDGLWALMPGNGGTNTDPHSIYFTAGLDGEQHGLFGSLTASSDVDTANSVSSSQSLLNLVQSAASFGANTQGGGSVTTRQDVDPALQGFLTNGAHHE
jgi:uncharacterized protein (TIGR03118 family)